MGLSAGKRHDQTEIGLAGVVNAASTIAAMGRWKTDPPLASVHSWKQ